LDVSPSNATPLIDVVVKLGGGVLASVEAADAVLEALRAAAQSCRLLVVPGGGPFADVVRDIDRRFGLSDDAAHWMAVLAMDQHAHVITGRLADAAMVSEPREIAGAIDAHRIPVLAPWRWLRATDPLPHSWDVTSDSIAAWVAGCVGARRLVLVKPTGVQPSDAAVDRYFARAVPDGVTSCIVPADRVDALNVALRG
jgi:5-(aminomethyl)-3-furanmethanol phosphate kinase